jgi:hypothetical protein
LLILRYWGDLEEQDEFFLDLARGAAGENIVLVI